MEDDRTCARTLVERGFVNLRRFSWERCARTVLRVMEGLLEEN